jgi:hypothetical protein
MASVMEMRGTTGMDIGCMSRGSSSGGEGAITSVRLSLVTLLIMRAFRKLAVRPGATGSASPPRH